jgi:hypothetical protein
MATHSRITAESAFLWVSVGLVSLLGLALLATDIAVLIESLNSAWWQTDSKVAATTTSLMTLIRWTLGVARAQSGRANQ